MDIDKPKETLEELLVMSPKEQEEFKKTSECQEALKKWRMFYPLQKNSMYGEELTNRLYKHI